MMVRGKNEYLKTSVLTGSDTNLFSLEAVVCRDETESDPEKKPKDYSKPCEKSSNESVYDVRTRVINQVRQADQ